MIYVSFKNNIELKMQTAELWKSYSSKMNELDLYVLT